MIPTWLVRDREGILVGPEEANVAYPETGADAMLSVEDDSFWFRHRNEVIALLLDRFVPGGEVWDVGGGNGYQAKMLQERGHPVVLVEPGVAGCRNAARRGVTNVIRSSLESLALPDGALSAVTLLDVIEHIPNPEALLVECRRALAPEGVVLVAVPAFDVLWSSEDDYAQHQRRYTTKLLRSQVEAAGLRLVWTSFYFGSLLLPILCFRAVPYRLSRLFPAREQGARPEPNLSHHRPGGPAQKVVETLLARELAALKSGRTLPLGSSIVAVAKRA